MPALEAMACGITPVLSNRSSFPEVVGDVGLLVEPDDPDDIAQALARILSTTVSNVAQRQRCIERAASFTWERSAQIALQAYQTLI